MRIRRNILILYFVVLLQGMVFYGPIATLYRRAAGIGIFEITLIESVCVALTLLLELPWGVVADRIGYRRTLLLCNALFFLSKIVFWRANSFAAFLLERVILAAVLAGLSGVDMSVLYLSCEKGKAQGVFGIYNNLGTAGLLAAAGVYAFFIGDDYRLAGRLTVLSYGLAALATLGIREVRPEATLGGRPAALWPVISALLKDGRYLLFLVGAALLAETNQTVTVFLSQLQYIQGSMGYAAIGVAYLLVTLAGLLGGFSARLTRRLTARRFGTLLYALAILACLALWGTRLAAVSVLAVMLLRVSASLFQPLLTFVQSARVRTADRATALSANAVIVESVAVLTNLAFGGVAKKNLPASMLMGAALCALGLILYRKMNWEDLHGQAEV
jgi:MFS family permease